jgi:hypothetical protein
VPKIKKKIFLAEKRQKLKKKKPTTPSPPESAASHGANSSTGPHGRAPTGWRARSGGFLGHFKKNSKKKS